MEIARQGLNSVKETCNAESIAGRVIVIPLSGIRRRPQLGESQAGAPGSARSCGSSPSSPEWIETG